MLLRKKDLDDTYQPASLEAPFRSQMVFVSPHSNWVHTVFGSEPLNAFENLRARLDAAPMPSAELVLAARAAMQRLDARKGEDVGNWATALGSDLGSHVD